MGTVNKYIKKLILTNEIDTERREQKKELTRKWDNEKWKPEMSNKTSLGIHRHWRQTIQEEET